jgi:probable rRNA maturation factor
MIRTHVTREAGFRVPDASTVCRVVRAVLTGEQRTSAALAVIFTDDERSTALNRRFLRHTYVTDVITFVLEAEPVLEAEIYINAEQARRQALEAGVTLREEYLRLVIHGVLHCCGYDDGRTKDRKVMFERQEAYVAALA